VSHESRADHEDRWGWTVGFRPQVTGLEVERAMWDEMNRRLTLLQGWRREAKRARGGKVGDSWKRRRSWQGLTVGGLGPEELARLMAWSVAAAERHKARPASPIG
jgi:hypothetical protein